MSSSRRPLVLAGAIIVFGSILVAALKNSPARLRAAFSSPPEEIFPPDVRQSAAEADRLLPPGAPAFFVTGDADTWTCGLWQRLLYPRPIFCLRGANPRHAEIFRDLRSQFSIRYAIGSGEPPAEVVLLRKTDLPGSRWLGELGP